MEKPQSQSKQQPKFHLYLLLQLEKDAAVQQIRKQYKKLVLKYHPDKNRQDPQARQKFQKLKEAYDILSNPQKKKIYDETGKLLNNPFQGTYGQQFDQNSFQSAYEYYRQQFKKVTPQDIIQFQKEYRHGAMQEQDLLDYYENHKGDMRQLIESIPLSQNQDIERFIKFYEQKMASKQIEEYKAFKKTKNKIKLIKDQSQELKMMEKQKMNELVLAIRGKANDQNGFLASLEAKYGGGKKVKAPKPSAANKKPTKESQVKKGKKATTPTSGEKKIKK